MSESLSVASSIALNGYAEVPTDLSRGDMQSAIDQYLEFLQLDPEYHEATRFFQSQRGDGDFGQFTRESGTIGARGQVQDNKDIFHYGAQTRSTVEARLGRRVPRPMKLFLDSAEEIFEHTQDAKRIAINGLDRFRTGLAEYMMPRHGTNNDVLRLIAYYQSPDKLAKGHFDRAVITLPMGESHEGLRVAPGENRQTRRMTREYMAELERNLQPVDYREGRAKVMLGAGWHRLPAEVRAGNEHLPLGWHDVVPSAKSVSERVMRWSVVLFTNPPTEAGDYAVPSPVETRPYKEELALV